MNEQIKKTLFLASFLPAVSMRKIELLFLSPVYMIYSKHVEHRT